MPGNMVKTWWKHSENDFTRLFYFSGPHFQTHLNFSFFNHFWGPFEPHPTCSGLNVVTEKRGKLQISKGVVKVAAGETVQFFQPSRSWKVFFRTINRSDDVQRIPWNLQVSTRTSLAAAEWKKTCFFDHGHHYKWQFSIAMLFHQRVNLVSHYSDIFRLCLKTFPLP